MFTKKEKEYVKKKKYLQTGRKQKIYMEKRKQKKD